MTASCRRGKYGGIRTMDKLILQNQLVIMRALWITASQPMSGSLLEQIELSRKMLYDIELREKK